MSNVVRLPAVAHSMRAPDALVAPAILAHLEHLRLLGRADTTIYGRRRALIRLAAALDPVPLLDAGPADLLAWRSRLHVTDEVITKYVTHADQFYGWAIGQGLLDSNPAAGLPVPSLHRRLPRPIAAEDLARALDCVSPRVRPWIMLAAGCGLRCCEIARLRVEDILYTARPPMLIVCGKGGILGAVPLPDVVALDLRAAGLPAHGWAFRRLDGRPGPNRAWVISQLIGEELRAAGIHATAHQLRHWYGIETLRANGGNLRETQEMMRHASPASTAIYTLILPIDAARTANKLPLPGPRRLRAAG